MLIANKCRHDENDLRPYKDGRVICMKCRKAFAILEDIPVDIDRENESDVIETVKFCNRDLNFKEMANLYTMDYETLERELFVALLKKKESSNKKEEESISVECKDEDTTVCNRKDAPLIGLQPGEDIEIELINRGYTRDGSLIFKTIKDNTGKFEDIMVSLDPHLLRIIATNIGVSDPDILKIETVYKLESTEIISDKSIREIVDYIESAVDTVYKSIVREVRMKELFDMLEGLGFNIAKDGYASRGVFGVGESNLHVGIYNIPFKLELAGYQYPLSEDMLYNDDVEGILQNIKNEISTRLEMGEDEVNKIFDFK